MKICIFIKIHNLTKTHIFQFLRVMPHEFYNFLRVNPGKNHIFGTVGFRTTNGTPRKYEIGQGTRNICKNPVLTNISLQIPQKQTGTRHIYI